MTRKQDSTPRPPTKKNKNPSLCIRENQVLHFGHSTVRTSLDFSSIMILQTCNMSILELVDTCKTNQSRLQKIWGQYTTYSGAKAGCSTINQPLGKGHLGARLDSSHRGKLYIYSNILSDILLDFPCGILIWIQVRRGAKSWRAHYTCQVRRGPPGGTKELASFLHRSRVAQGGLLERLASWRGRRRRSNRDVSLKSRDPHLARVPVLNIPSNQCMILSWTLSESLISGCLGTLGTWLQHDWDKFRSRGISEILQNLARAPGPNKMRWVLSFSHAFYVLFTFNWERTHPFAFPVIALSISLYLVIQAIVSRGQHGNAGQKLRTVVPSAVAPSNSKLPILWIEWKVSRLALQYVEAVTQ